MEHEGRSLRVGTAVIICAVLLRLASTGFFDPAFGLLTRPEIASFVIYLETGRVVRPAQSSQILILKPETQPTQPTQATLPVQPTEAATVPTFIEETVPQIRFKYDFNYTADVEKLLQTPLNWGLTGDGPTVLIVHTHATESYTKAGEDYEESSAYRTLNEEYNMICVGDRLAEALEAGGVQVLHDRTLHDYPSYSGSYENSRKTVNDYLARYPSIRLILDLHRDAAEDGNGNQLATSADVDGERAAQLLLVLGSNAGALTHPNWEENLGLAVKLQAQLEKLYPGLCRPIHLTEQRYNQDLSPGALLVEVGAAGNTRDQALIAAEALAQGILALAKG